MRDIFEELERRKEAREDPCDSCDATGVYRDSLCPDCLGQRILLTREEYDLVLKLANRADDEVLEAEFLDA